MKNMIIGLVFITTLATLISCSKKDDIPYALSGEQYKVIYIVPEEGNEEQLKWLQEFEDEHEGVNLIAFDLELTQKEYPSLEATKSPYIYILGKRNIVFESSNLEDAKRFLIDNTN
ncbi:hypothetical protein [Litchfieldia salsa]|uniref:Uncharacterized protein n=1 Tax=Litchfieldia salsa TaxID=930152 RepID=A0A1H0X0G3_9BACI|nr:hypothetical protein [Litchfieldia salsa]SDP96474.1 hypothetical protein SAMN05216565_12157 [Litchfieldia salsa]